MLKLSRKILASIPELGEKYLSPSLKTFRAFDSPVVLTKGHMQHVWTDDDKKYLDLIGQNLSISVGHCHPKVVDAMITQLHKLPHCTTMYHHEEPTMLAKELVEKFPNRSDGEDWVVHPVNSGSEAVDLAIQMAAEHTKEPSIMALHNAYHGLHGYAAGATTIGKAKQSCHSKLFPCVSQIPANDINALKSHLEHATSGKIGGIIMEPIQGYGGVLSLNDNDAGRVSACRN